MTPHEQQARHDVINLVLSTAAKHAGVHWQASDINQWMHPSMPLQPHWRARGWTDLIPNKDKRVVRWNPDTVCAATEHLDFDGDDTMIGDPTDLTYYLHVVGNLIVHQERHYANVDPMGTALDQVAHADPFAVHVLWQVQCGMLDQISVRPDLVGSQAWADQQEIDLTLETTESSN